MKVLIAEDEAVSQAIVKRSIEKLGHECLVGKDGLEAWKIYQEVEDIDASVSDWMMPNVDGLELCRKVRETEREETTRSSSSPLGSREHLLEGMKAGANLDKAGRCWPERAPSFAATCNDLSKVFSRMCRQCSCGRCGPKY